MSKKQSTANRKPAPNDNSWLANTVTLARIQVINEAGDKWVTLGECVDTPNKIKAELSKPEYQGHDIWIRDAFGDRRYVGRVK